LLKKTASPGAAAPLSLKTLEAVARPRDGFLRLGTIEIKVAIGLSSLKIGPPSAR
jgi:hypothetical protein